MSIQRPLTRYKLRRMFCSYERDTHCPRCRRKVQQWRSGVKKTFLLDILPTGDTTDVMMHRFTCPVLQRLAAKQAAERAGK